MRIPTVRSNRSVLLPLNPISPDLYRSKAADFLTPHPLQQNKMRTIRRFVATIQVDL